MCGIVGCYASHVLPESSSGLIGEMNQLLSHRGPDDHGVHRDPYCVLGHRRLAIIDLSPGGHQPYLSDDGRYAMLFNGEIYNYIELREDLEREGIRFKSASDSEVLLRMYERYGKDCLGKLNGMFAFTVYDRQTRSLFLARDRVGVKPLYYATVGGVFYFASETKALRRIPGIDRALNYSALFDYLCFNRTDVSDETFHLSIRKVPKGHYAVIDGNGLRITKWWDPSDYVRNDEQIVSEKEILERIEEIFVSAVKLRMRSDVPVGSCLSGGLDSSIILGIIQQHKLARDNYKTFTVSYPGSPVDESQYIEELSRRYSFPNFKTFPNEKTAADNFEKFSYYMDEPCSSPTFYSQYEVMRLARQHGITVLLDGQGGDEVFAGYQYFHGFNFSELFRRRRYGKLIVELLSCVMRGQEKESYLTFLFQELPDSIKKKLLLRSIGYVSPDFFNKHIEDSLIFQEFFRSQSLNDSLAQHFKYKLEHLLRAEDRNSMAFSIEARVPYLDYRLIEYSLSIPGALKIQKGQNKILQKKALGKYTVEMILERKDKIGFGTPAQAWMRSPVWEDMTRQNYEYVQRALPEVFETPVQLKYNLFDRWKVNQIASWLKMNSHG